MSNVIINNNLYASAVAGITTLNGMYIFYGSSIVTPTSGADISTLSATVTSTPGAGMARCYGLISTTASDAYCSTTIVSGGVTSTVVHDEPIDPDDYISGGIVLSTAVLSGTVQYVGTTANAEIIAGVPLTPGISVNALGLAHLTPNAYNKGGVICSSGYLEDKILDYSAVSGGITVPAGGYVTLIDNLTVVSEDYQ